MRKRRTSQRRAAPDLLEVGLIVIAVCIGTLSLGWAMVRGLRPDGLASAALMETRPKSSRLRETPDPAWLENVALPAIDDSTVVRNREAPVVTANGAGMGEAGVGAAAIQVANDIAPGLLDHPLFVAGDPMASTVATYDDRELEVVGVVNMRVTAYSPDEASCGSYADGFTASGYSVWTNGMRLVAADPTVLPLGSILAVPGYNQNAPVPVLDVGGAIKGNRLDVLFPTHEEALRWGVRHLDVTIYRYRETLIAEDSPAVESLMD